MIRDLREVNRLLFVLHQYQFKSTNAKELVRALAHTPVMERISVDHYDTIEFCRKAWIIVERRDKIKLSVLGRKLMEIVTSKNPSYSYELTDGQEKLLNEAVFLNRKLDSPIGRVFSTLFTSDDSRKTWYYDYTENPPLDEEFLDFARLLKQTKLLLEHDGMFEINPIYAPMVSQLVSESGRPTLSLSDLQRTLEERDKTGKAAEAEVLRFERTELANRNCRDEADLVVSISDWDVAAGYDIKSFRGKSLTKIHDKFIEVKGSKNFELRFFWSANELRKAQQLQDKYWIYFVGGIGSKRKTLEPIMIQNPIRSILKSSRYKKEITGYEISLEA